MFNIKKIVAFIFIMGLVYCSILKTQALTVSSDDTDYETDIKASYSELETGMDIYQNDYTIDVAAEYQYNIGNTYYIVWDNRDNKTIIYVSDALSEVQRIVISEVLKEVTYADNMIYGVFEKNNQTYWGHWDLEGLMNEEIEVIAGGRENGAYYYYTTYAKETLTLHQVSSASEATINLKNTIIEDTINVVLYNNIIYWAYYGTCNDNPGSYVLEIDNHFKLISQEFLTSAKITAFNANNDLIFSDDEGLHFIKSNDKEIVKPIYSIERIDNVQGNTVVMSQNDTYLINRQQDECVNWGIERILAYDKGVYTVLKNSCISQKTHLSVTQHEETIEHVKYKFKQLYVGYNALSIIRLPAEQYIYGTYYLEEVLTAEEVTYYDSNCVIVPLKTNVCEGHCYDIKQKVTFNAVGTLNGEPLTSGMTLDQLGSYTLILKGIQDEITTITLEITSPLYEANPVETTLSTALLGVNDSQEASQSDAVMPLSFHIEEVYKSQDTYWTILILGVSLAAGILSGYLIRVILKKRGRLC